MIGHELKDTRRHTDSADADQRADCDLNIQLLAQLTGQAGLRRLARLDFPTRELPALCVCQAGATTRQQDCAMLLNNGGSDPDHALLHCFLARMRPARVILLSGMLPRAYRPAACYDSTGRLPPWYRTQGGAPMDERVIITCALTGGIHGKEANPQLPEQPDEIVAQGVAAWREGAAILHVHARNPDGSNTMSPTIYRELHERLCAETDAIIQLTTGGSPRLPVAERLNTVLLAPEMCSLNLGLLNFFIRGEQVFFSNHRSDILHFAREMRARGVKPELEAYNEAMLEEAEHLIASGLLEPPYLINCVLHTPTQGGVRGTPHNLLEMLERLPPGVIANVSSMGRT